MDYKIIIFGNHIYKEIELFEDETKSIIIGTTLNCQVRFNREYFFSDFEITVSRINGQWTLGCNEAIYLKTEVSLKQYFLKLMHNDTIQVCYDSTNSCLFSIDFMYDYDREHRAFNHYINIEGRQNLSIGNKNDCEIIINEPDIQGECFWLCQDSGNYQIRTTSNKIVIYKNGYKSNDISLKICDGDFWSVGGYTFFLQENQLFLNSLQGLSTRLSIQNNWVNYNTFIYPKFKRNIRLEYTLPDNRVEILPPKSMSEPPKRNLLMTILPVLASLILIVALRGVMGSGGTFIIYSAATMAIGGLMSVWTYFSEGKDYKKNNELRKEKYELYISQQEEKITFLRQEELNIMNFKFMALTDEVGLVRNFDRRLFERRREDNDFKILNLGTGRVASSLSIKCKEIEYKDVDDPLQDYPIILRDRYKYLENHPVILDLKLINAFGIIGTKDKLYQLLKNIVLDLSIRQYYADLKYYFIFQAMDTELFQWLRWLKNTHFMYDDESIKQGLEFLYGELCYRASVKDENNKFDEDYIIFVFKFDILENHPISQYLSRAQKLGFSFIFFEENIEQVNQNCDMLINLDSSSRTANLISCKSSQQQLFNYPHISSNTAYECALKLGCIFVDEISLEKSLTKNISLFELINIMNVNDINLENNWSNSKIYETMAVPLGVGSGDEVVYLDLHEKFHGPHGLVAGTTGAGKSEILQSFILSMAIHFHPYDAGFMIIDFKGGGMVNQFEKLPHLYGAITNIDNSEIERSLLSIRAELRKRQEKFAEFDVNHIDAYIKKFKSGEASVPIPHLILIVDEFAELKSEQPEFMKELISTARIGRSLGVHLILATQKPSGVVDNQIWSNSKFKLCLKVQNKEDSMEVLKSPSASEIKEPGRAYLQVGNNEIFQLFQSAYSGALAESDGVGKQRRYKISKKLLSGKRELLYEQKPEQVTGSKTQLQAIVDYIEDYCKYKGLDKVPGICLPPLCDSIPWTCPARNKVITDIVIPIGILDDPERQLQIETELNLTQNHVFILGAAQFGKTNILQTMVRSLTSTYDPDEVNLYILDFASMALKQFENLPHVGGVITSMEDEKLKTFMKMMAAEIKIRKEVLLKYGSNSFSTFNEIYQGKIPQIVIMIDNVTAFRELYENHEDGFLNLCREGLSVGMSVIVTNLQTSGFGYKYLSNFSKRICLYCNDSNEYTYLFDHCRKKLPNITGRALVEINRKVYEVQIYQAFEGEKEIEKNKNMSLFIDEINTECGLKRAKKIPEIPKTLTNAYVKKYYPHCCLDTYEIYLGINFATNDIDKICLTNQGIMGLCGKSGFGKTNFVRYMLNTLHTQKDTALTEYYVIDSIERKFKYLNDMYAFNAYTIDASETKIMMSYFIEILEERYQWLINNEEALIDKAPLILWIINNNDVFTLIDSDSELNKQYRQICTKYKDLKICMIYTNLENVPISYNAPEILKLFRDNKNLLYFNDISELKLCDVPFSIVKEYSKPIIEGEAFYLSGNSVSKVKTILYENNQTV